ncbi:MAG: YifB family Mg chelatase-like AAA ATPase [Actinomycetota bacterium]|nr:YifB family Mg chelatase-like AAA ATPase [Actinomycetota bacterium]
MLARTRTLALHGVDAIPVDVEIDIHRGLPAFSLVGLPDAAVRESRERVRAAIVNCGFDFPLARITANLAPADLRKAGPGFDLAIAAAILCASEQIPERPLADWWLAGELALDGSIRGLPGVLAMTEEAARNGGCGIAIAAANAAEARLVEGVTVAALATLTDLATLARGELPPAPATSAHENGGPPFPDLADVRGQPGLRRGLEVAAAGGHGALVIGPPGAGKSLAARRLPSILPPLSRSEAIEVTKIASVAGRPALDGTLAQRPFRAPHHTISPAGLVGGGSPPRPGEITLAHRGVLFLDELGEFARSTLEALRQPLEDGRVTIARARDAITFPARFQIFAAANPCPCGHGEDSRQCNCRPDQIRAYASRLSGALADRFDLSMLVEQPSADALGGDPGESSASVAERVLAARHRQEARLGPGRCNASMTESELAVHVHLGAEAGAVLANGHGSMGLSGRGWNRVLKVARTLADLRGLDAVGAAEIDSALIMRRRGST